LFILLYRLLSYYCSIVFSKLIIKLSGFLAASV